MKSPSSSVTSKTSSALATQRSSSSSSSPSLSRVASPIIGDDDYISQFFTFTPQSKSAKNDPSLVTATKLQDSPTYASVVTKETAFSVNKEHPSVSNLSILKHPASNPISKQASGKTTIPKSVGFNRADLIVIKKMSVYASLSKKFKSPVSSAVSVQPTILHSKFSSAVTHIDSKTNKG